MYNLTNRSLSGLLRGLRDSLLGLRENRRGLLEVLRGGLRELLRGLLEDLRGLLEDLRGLREKRRGLRERRGPGLRRGRLLLAGLLSKLRLGRLRTGLRERLRDMERFLPSSSDCQILECILLVHTHTCTYANNKNDNAAFKSIPSEAAETLQGFLY